MSLIAIAVGVVTGFITTTRRALIAAGVVWLVTTVYLALIAGGGPVENPDQHDLTAGFWIGQVVILVVSLGAASGASMVRNRRMRLAS